MDSSWGPAPSGSRAGVPEERPEEAIGGRRLLFEGPRERSWEQSPVAAGAQSILARPIDYCQGQQQARRGASLSLWNELYVLRTVEPDKYNCAGLWGPEGYAWVSDIGHRLIQHCWSLALPCLDCGYALTLSFKVKKHITFFFKAGAQNWQILEF